MPGSSRAPTLYLEMENRLSMKFYHLGHIMQICVFMHMQTAKAQISLHIRAVWSGSLLSANRSLDTTECMECKSLDDTLRMQRMMSLG